MFNSHSFRRRLRAAVPSISIPPVLRQVTGHALRHTFATHALENCTDTRTLQELLGRNDVSPVMIYTDVMNRPGVGMRRSYRTLG